MTIRFHIAARTEFESADDQTQAEAKGALELLSVAFEIPWFNSTGPGLWFAGARPDPNTKKLFGLDLDCFVIGNGKSVDFHPKTLAQPMPAGMENHFDPGIRLLVSADPSAEAGCAAWAAANRVGIVVLRAGLLLDSSSEEALGELHGILSSCLWRKDLFDESEPVRLPREFFGREAVRSEILAKLMVGSSTAVFGLRKVGKSSLLGRVEDALAGDVTSVSVTALLLGNSAKLKNGRWWMAAQSMVAMWQDKLQLIAKTAGSKIQAQATQMQEAIAKKVVDTPRLASAFEKDIASLLKAAEALRSALRRDSLRLVLIIDDCDELYPQLSEAGQWRTDFFVLWNTLQNIKRRIDNSGHLVWILAGSSPSGVERGSLLEQPNPLFGTKEVYLGPMNREQAGSLLRGLGGRMGLSFDEGAIDSIFTLVGGHPFLLRRFGSFLHSAALHRCEMKAVSSEMVSDIFKKNKRAFYNQVMWMLDHLGKVAPDEERLLRDVALGGAQAYEMWKDNDLRETFAFNLERYGLVRFSGDLPIVDFPLVREALQKPASGEFEEQKRQLKSLVDAIEAALRARIAVDCARDRNATDAIHAVVNAIPSDAKNRPLGRQELIDIGEVAGLSAILESMNWGDYEILLNKFYEEIEWCGPPTTKQERLGVVKRTFLQAHLVRHNNDRELRELIKNEGFPALFGRFCAVRDMLAAGF